MARALRPTAGAGHARRIDFVLYRDAGGVTPTPIDVGEARDFSADGRPLSGHPAVSAKFRVTRASP